jgi:methyltransferase
METATLLFLGFIIVQRLSELAIAKQNTARLLAKGAYEVGAAHYPVMVAMHGTWIACLLIFGYDETVALGWLAVFTVLQIFRVWILGSLGGSVAKFGDASKTRILFSARHLWTSSF